jgi:hypothetical protein
MGVLRDLPWAEFPDRLHGDDAGLFSDAQLDAGGFGGIQAIPPVEQLSRLTIGSCPQRDRDL